MLMCNVTDISAENEVKILRHELPLWCAAARFLAGIDWDAVDLSTPENRNALMQSFDLYFAGGNILIPRLLSFKERYKQELDEDQELRERLQEEVEIASQLILNTINMCNFATHKCFSSVHREVERLLSPVAHDTVN
jgi:hypothetical protein